MVHVLNVAPILLSFLLLFTVFFKVYMFHRAQDVKSLGYE